MRQRYNSNIEEEVTKKKRPVKRKAKSKKFKHGGVTHRQSMSEQAEQMVGYQTWNTLDAIEKGEVVSDLVSEGAIVIAMEDGGMMAKGGEVGQMSVAKSYWNKFDKKQKIDFLVGAGYSKSVANDLSSESWDSLENGVHNDLRAVLMANGGMMADGGYMAKGGGIRKIRGNNFATQIENSSKFKKLILKVYERQNSNDTYPLEFIRAIALTEHPIVRNEGKNYVKGYSHTGTISYFPFLDDVNFIEALKYVDRPAIRKFAEGGALSHSDQMIDIMNAEREAEARMGQSHSDQMIDIMNAEREAEGDYEDYERHLKVVRTQFEDEDFEYAGGGGVATEEPIAFVVGYNPKGQKTLKEKSFDSKKKAETFFDMMSEEEDVENIYLKSIYPEAVAIAAAAPAKSLFGAAKAAPKTAASKKEKESVVVAGIADEIARYDELKAIINNAKAEQEVIGGRLKETGVNQYLEIYQERRRNPDTFNLADRDEKIMFIVMDKYKKVEPEKAALLENYDGLLETTTKYSFNPEILDRVGEVVSRIITDSSLLTQQDKDNLIIAETSVSIKKGTIDRLMDYENPVEIFALIEPILALK